MAKRQTKKMSETSTKSEVYNSLHQKVYIKKFILKSLYEKVYIKKFILKFIRIYIGMKHGLYIHQDYQPLKLSLYLLDEISCELAHFAQLYMQSVIIAGT